MKSQLVSWIYCHTKYYIYGCHILQDKLHSCCLCVFLFLHRLRWPWNPPRSYRKNYLVHCHSSCTFWSLSSLLGYQCIEISSSSEIKTILFQRCTIKTSACKKSLRQKQMGTFSTQRLVEGFFFTCKQPWQYLNLHLHYGDIYLRV